MLILISAFLLSFFINLCVIFLSRHFHLFIDSEQSNKPQKFHTLPTPRAGGIGIFMPFLLIMIIFLENDWIAWLDLFQIGNGLDEWILNTQWWISNWDDYVQASHFLLGLLIGGSIIFTSGIVEDFNTSLSPKFRLLIQCLGALAFIWISQSYLSDLGFGIILPSYIGIPFSIFAIVGIINALNIIDGFNGLASGVTLMALICINSILPSSPISFSLLILFASTLGFFILNFPKGKIFLGDGGAYFLGFILAAILIYITQIQGFEQTENIGQISPWFGIALLIYPFWEVIFSIFRKKFIRGKSPMQPDRFHFHMLIHKHITHNNPKTSLIILAYIAPFMFLSVLFAKNQWNLLLVGIAFILSYLWLYRYLIGLTLKKNKA